MKNAYAKVKKFMADHEEGIFLGSMFAIAAAGAALTVYATADAAKKQKEMEAWVREQNFQGKAVYQLANGEYLAVSQDQVS